MQSIQSKKTEFAKKEIAFLVFQAALIRGYPSYKPSVNEKRRMEFKDYLSELLEKFAKRCQSEEYIKILNDFQREINNSEYKDILNGRSITFGRVQKLLNLYLKYLWVFDLMKNEPPHCPIDSIILNEIKWGEPKWTKPKFTEKEYIKAIDMCKKKSKDMGVSVAQWELLTFKDRASSIVEKL